MSLEELKAMYVEWVEIRKYVISKRCGLTDEELDSAASNVATQAAKINSQGMGLRKELGGLTGYRVGNKYQVYKALERITGIRNDL